MLLLKNTRTIQELKGHFSFKEIQESDIQKEVFHLNSKKAGPFGNVRPKVVKDSSNICNSILEGIWNNDILGKPYLPKKFRIY